MNFILITINISLVIIIFLMRISYRGTEQTLHRWIDTFRDTASRRLNRIACLESQLDAANKRLAQILELLKIDETKNRPRD